jgi:hypothetical protein
VPARAVILKSAIYNFHRFDLTRQAGFIVTVYDEDGLKLAATNAYSNPTEAFAEAQKIVDGKVEGPRKKNCVSPNDKPPADHRGWLNGFTFRCVQRTA